MRIPGSSPSGSSENKSQHLQRLTRSILSLPTLPTVTARLLEWIDHPRVSAQQLSKVIEQDQVLTARLLKMANSAYYGLSRQVNTVKMAVVVLGYSQIKELSLSLSVLDTFRDKKIPLLEMSQFWKHSVAVGLASRYLAKAYMPALKEDAFVAGLLHDIGKLVMAEYTSYQPVLEEHHLSGSPLETVEKEKLGADHAQIGSWLADQWKLPLNLVNAIKGHHEPDWDGPGLSPGLLVFLADYFTHQGGLSLGSSGRKLPVLLSESDKEKLITKLGLSSLSDIDALSLVITEEIKSHRDAFYEFLPGAASTP